MNAELNRELLELEKQFNYYRWFDNWKFTKKRYQATPYQQEGNRKRMISFGWCDETELWMLENFLKDIGSRPHTIFEIKGGKGKRLLGVGLN